ncbi:helix-turn-helix domain-containing protein [Paenibacillus sp. J2TS4]|uniref:helix-turn-helix domain-containing protein n=1 Tax=Paenibacillus sp. J2TS4 TaxID=2807194 RepID=UPI001B2901DD|nr:helix-turn-helix transcriptional regulator [Paenibacillus sp. J2TS4]GIP36367.1 putative HTH-type transcriptional regulator YazB [Paenibacillus sp. J2TS4]
METNELAARIRAFRKLKGVTQIELAELLGISVSIVGSIERGTRKADARTINRIAEVLGVEPEDLLPSTLVERS